MISEKSSTLSLNPPKSEISITEPMISEKSSTLSLNFSEISDQYHGTDDFGEIIDSVADFSEISTPVPITSIRQT